jgi:hypothetical protein
MALSFPLQKMLYMTGRAGCNPQFASQSALICCELSLNFSTLNNAFFRPPNARH